MKTQIFKTKLEEEKKLLEKELGEMGQVVNEATGEWDVVVKQVTEEVTSDENDKADRFEEYEEQSARLKTLAQRLKDVSDALAKIEGGKFGICEVGGDKIEEDRLEANPSARTCKEHMYS